MPPAIDTKLSFELAVFGMADELDVPARRLRGGLIKLVKRMRETNVTLDTMQRYLDAWTDAAPAAPHT